MRLMIALAFSPCAAPATAADAPKYRSGRRLAEAAAQSGSWEAAGVAVDAQDHVWSSSGRRRDRRRKGAALDPPRTKSASRRRLFSNSTRPATCCARAGRRATTGLTTTWHLRRRQGFVWLASNGEPDGQVLKFTKDGKFVLQIGKQGRRPIRRTRRA